MDSITYKDTKELGSFICFRCLLLLMLNIPYIFLIKVEFRILIEFLCNVDQGSLHYYRDLRYVDTHVHVIWGKISLKVILKLSLWYDIDFINMNFLLRHVFFS